MTRIGSIDLDHAAIGQILKGDEMRAALREIADGIVDAVKLNPAVIAHGAEVYAEDYTTDRAVVAVTLDSPIGVGIEAKHGPMRAAASAAGLRVSGEV